VSLLKLLDPTNGSSQCSPTLSPLSPMPYVAWPPVPVMGPPARVRSTPTDCGSTVAGAGQDQSPSTLEAVSVSRSSVSLWMKA
jgi:hypothetical protein